MPPFTKLIFFIFFLFACSAKKQTDNKQRITKAITNIETIQPTFIDTLYKLLNKAANADSLEFDNYPPFLYLKSGNFLTPSQKNAILIYVPDDSTFTIEIYSLNENNWIKNSEIKSLDAKIMSFNAEYRDFNFDGFNDIYIQQTASNGLVMSRGYLLTIDPKEKTFFLHKEVKEEANLIADSKTKTVYADELIECKQTTFREVCKRAFKWEGNTLVKKGRTCPCEAL